MGFPAEDLTTNTSKSLYTRWLQAGCQPNYRQVIVDSGLRECYGVGVFCDLYQVPPH